MKKLFALLMALMLALPSLAGAEGLGGLGGGDSAGGQGLSGLRATDAPNPNLGVVPDAADLIGGSKTVLRSNYEFAKDRFFMAYTYEMPDDVESFTNAYVAEAEKNGFTVEQTTVEGYDARQITWVSGAYALLVPNFDGQVLLLVQMGMNFGVPNYIQFEYNGEMVRKVSGHRGYSSGTTFSEKKYSFYSTFFSIKEDAPISYFSFAFPDDVQAGKEYSLNKSSYKGGFRLALDSYNNYYLDFPGTNAFMLSEDYFKLSVISVETVPDWVIIEANFEGRFSYDDVTITNGYFKIAFPTL